MNILFVCSRNIWRSPTAENIYRNRSGLKVRSAGTSSSARIRVSASMLAWAELIFVMEKDHKKRLQNDFRNEVGNKTIIVLDIPDEYEFMDPELNDMIRMSVDPFLDTL